MRLVIRETDSNGLDDKTGVDEDGHDFIDLEWIGKGAVEPPKPE